MGRNIILASKSPRRKELLSLLGIPFKILESDYDEDHSLKMSPRDLVKFLALLKARDVATKAKDALIISADTLVVYKGNIYTKPQNEKDARGMLQKLNGTKHSVITGLVVYDSQNDSYKASVVESEIELKRLSNREIDDYIKTGEYIDKAGAYAVQGRASIFVKKIHGEPTAVIGLPLYELSQLLAEFGVFVMSFWGNKKKQ